MVEDRQSLRPIGTWDGLWRGSFAIDHQGSEYVIDVDFFDFSERIFLYRDGVLLDSHKSPAQFEIDVNTVAEAAMSLYGMKQVDLVYREDGNRVQVQPREGTGEAWRANLSRKQPVLSRWIGISSWSVLVFAAVTQIPVLFNSTIAHLIGMQLPTLELPDGVNAALGVAGIIAALDRALQLKYNRWLDS